MRAHAAARAAPDRDRQRLARADRRQPHAGEAGAAGAHLPLGRGVVAAAAWRFFLGLNDRRDEVQQRCQSELQTAAFPDTARHPERRARRLQHRERILQATLAM